MFHKYIADGLFCSAWARARQVRHHCFSPLAMAPLVNVLRRPPVVAPVAAPVETTTETEQVSEPVVEKKKKVVKKKE